MSPARLRNWLSDSDLARSMAAREIAVAVLVMSNKVAKRASLRRYMDPDSAPERGIYVPRRGVLSRLKAAVALQAAEVPSCSNSTD
jgi:hypothetical protein